MQAHKPKRQQRRTLVYEATRSPSIAILRGLETPIAPGQRTTRPILSPSPQTLKPLPPTPPESPPLSPLLTPTEYPAGPSAAAPKSAPAVAPAGSNLRRVSSLHAATSPGAWLGGESSKTYREGDELDIRYSINKSHQINMFSASTPLLLKTPESQYLEHRVYSPLLPEPSPSITPVSRRSVEYVEATPHIISQYAPKANNVVELWRTLPPSPPATAPIPPMAARLFSPRSTEHLASPRYSAPPQRAKSSDPPTSRQGKAPDVSHQRESSIEKVLQNLGVNEEGQPDEKRGRKKTRQIAPRSTHYNHYHPGAKSKSKKPKEIKDEPGWEDYTGDVDSEGEYILSAEYHTALVDQYRALAAPVQGQWDESTDEEESAHNFRFVPKPLFWKTKDGTVEQQQHDHVTSPQRKPGASRHRKSSTSTSVPLKMMLPSHFNRRRDSSTEMRKTDDKPKKTESTKVRSRKPRAAPSKRTSALYARPTSKKAGHVTKKQIVNVPPIPLQLPQSVAAEPRPSLGPRKDSLDVIQPQQHRASEPTTDNDVGLSPEPGPTLIRPSRHASPARTPKPKPNLHIATMQQLTGEEHFVPSVAVAASHMKSASASTTHSAQTNGSDLYDTSPVARSSLAKSPVADTYPRPMSRDDVLVVKPGLGSPTTAVPSPITPPPAPLKSQSIGYGSGIKNALKFISPGKLSRTSFEFPSPRGSLQSHHAISPTQPLFHKRNENRNSASSSGTGGGYSSPKSFSTTNTSHTDAANKRTSHGSRSSRQTRASVETYNTSHTDHSQSPYSPQSHLHSHFKDEHDQSASPSKSRVSMPKLVSKAVSRASRDKKKREKRRVDLKASIKLVGEADPSRDVDFAARNRSNSRRETFGAGWI
jgi:hypothetical protein